MATEFSTIGLLMAGATSVSNVLKDVAGKKVLDNHEVVATTFWLRLIVLCVVGVVWTIQFFWSGVTPELRDGGEIFGIEALHFAPLPTFLFYLIIDCSMVGLAAYLFQRALKLSPLSVCVPFLAFTPIFLIPTGYVLLGELPPTIKLLGVVLVVVGSLVMHRQLFKVGLFAPFVAVWREKGSRYVLIVAFIFSLTNPLDKKLVTMSDSFTQSLAYSFGLFVFFAALALTQKAEIGTVVRKAPRLLLLAGLFDATALIMQLTSHLYIDVVITISVKRAGIILAVVLGWLIFRERNITDKLIASAVMLGGVLIIYLPLNVVQSLIFTILVLSLMATALYFTRNQLMSVETEQEVSPLVNE